MRSTKLSFAGSNEDVLVGNLVLHHIMTCDEGCDLKLRSAVHGI